MESTIDSPTRGSSLPTVSETSTSHEVFTALHDGIPETSSIRLGANFLTELLQDAGNVATGLPSDPSDLPEWMFDQVKAVGESYEKYQQSRAAGKGRRYFRNKAHALNFLRSVAPTKLADGAWLYGLLARWEDPRFTHLIETYLEELGDGSPSKNHVALYKKLLLSHGCENWNYLTDAHYTQGAIQLSMAYNSSKFLPEIIGYNLGYEQLPLHLLITAYELKELKIDPYYFTLHITVDNADSGHARKAVDAVHETMPNVGDPQEWYRRVRNGFALNFLGSGTLSVIEEFDIEQEIVQVFRDKCHVGRHLHPHTNLIGGRPMNSWLSDPDSMGDLLKVLVADRWIIRNDDPAKSRFWNLFQSNSATMFGAFSAYEQQVIYDWIAGDFKGGPLKLNRPMAPEPTLDPDTLKRLRHEEDCLTDKQRIGDYGSETQNLDDRIARLAKRDAMDCLIDLMSPALHHSTAGLKATRMFIEIYR